MHNAKLGAERIATPFSQEFCILCFMPVYPGAPRWGRSQQVIRNDDKSRSLERLFERNG
jgi:hypothetical protein